MSELSKDQLLKLFIIAKKTKQRIPKLEDAIKTDAKTAYDYAILVLRQQRFEEAEPYIAKNLDYAIAYALNIVNGGLYVPDDWRGSDDRYIDGKITPKRWVEGEPYLMKDARSAYLYAKFILKSRWPEAEKYIIKNIDIARKYERDVVKGKWPELQKWQKDNLQRFEEAKEFKELSQRQIDKLYTLSIFSLRRIKEIEPYLNSFQAKSYLNNFPSNALEIFDNLSNDTIKDLSNHNTPFNFPSLMNIRSISINLLAIVMGKQALGIRNMELKVTGELETLFSSQIVKYCSLATKNDNWRKALFEYILNKSQYKESKESKVVDGMSYYIYTNDKLNIKSILVNYNDKVICEMSVVMKKLYEEVDTNKQLSQNQIMKLYHLAIETHQRMPIIEPIVLNSLKDISQFNLDYPDPIRYAENAIQGRWPELEDKILKRGSANIMIWYVEDVLKSRWPEAEQYILKSKTALKKYARLLNLQYEFGLDSMDSTFLNKGNNNLDKVVEKYGVEEVAKHYKNMYNGTIIRFIEKYIKKPVPEVEHELLSDVASSYTYSVKYAIEIKKDRWPELEDKLSNVVGFSSYASQCYRNAFRYYKVFPFDGFEKLFLKYVPLNIGDTLEKKSLTQIVKNKGNKYVTNLLNQFKEKNKDRHVSHDLDKSWKGLDHKIDSLINFVNNKQTLNESKQLNNNQVEKLMSLAIKTKTRIPELEQQLLNDLKQKNYFPNIKYSVARIYAYADNVLKDRWKEAEQYIMYDPQIAALYSKRFFNGRWREAEKYYFSTVELEDDKQEYLNALWVINQEHSNRIHKNVNESKQLSLSQIEKLNILAIKTKQCIPELEDAYINYFKNLPKKHNLYQSGIITSRLVDYVRNVKNKKWPEIATLLLKYPYEAGHYNHYIHDDIITDYEIKHKVNKHLQEVNWKNLAVGTAMAGASLIPFDQQRQEIPDASVQQKNVDIKNKKIKINHIGAKEKQSFAGMYDLDIIEIIIQAAKYYGVDVKIALAVGLA